MLLMIGFGCSKETKVVNTPTVAQEIDNKTLEVESQILAPWDEKKKNFWISVYFARMSYQPNIRERFLPHILYGVCECIIGELEKEFDLEEFEERFKVIQLVSQYQRFKDLFGIYLMVVLKFGFKNRCKRL